MVLQCCLSLQDRLKAYRSENLFYALFAVSSNLWFAQFIARNSSIDLPSNDLFGFERARQKFLLPLTAHVSLESEDLLERDIYCHSEGDLDLNM
jgi:hypothetical protein